MRYRNGQSKQQPSRKQSHSLSFNHQNMLNQMYDRVCNQQGSSQQECSNIRPLLSYLSISGHNSQVQQKNVQSHIDPNIVSLTYQEQDIRQKNHFPKKYSIQERVKTDMQEMNTFENQEIHSLKLENELLRKKLIKCQKKIIRLESFQSEVEYLKKLSLLQHAEVEKLRIMLRNIQLEQVQKNIDNFRSIESQPIPLKENKHDKNVFVSTQTHESTQYLQKKKPRCSHKQNFNRKDKQNDGNLRPHSTFFESKNKQTIDRGTKGISFQHKSSKLKNKKTTIRLD